MKRTRFSLLIALIAMSLSVGAQGLQQILSNLNFDAPKALYRAKGNNCNMRTQPNAKAAKVNFRNNEYYHWLPNCYLVNDLGDNAAWVSANVEGKNVYVSKSVLTGVTPQPFSPERYQNTPYVWVTTNEPDGSAGWEGQAMSWRIGKVKGNCGLWVCQTQEYDGALTLRLGKLVDNVLVFKYCINFNIYDRWTEGVNKWNVESEISEEWPYAGSKVYYLQASEDFKFSTTYDFPDDGGGMLYEALDLTKLTEPMVYVLFKDVIDRNEIKNFYLTSYNFSGKWQRTFI